MKKALLWLIVIACLAVNIYKIYRVYQEGTLQELIPNEISKLNF